MRGVLPSSDLGRNSTQESTTEMRGSQVQTDNRWLTISEAARYIGMSVAFLRKAVRLRSVPHTRVGAKALRFDREALDAWLLANGCGGEIPYTSKSR
jgi:excisionase family DNA binding protein